jgi:hypothetical protein
MYARATELGVTRASSLPLSASSGDPRGQPARLRRALSYIAPVVWDDPWRQTLSTALPDNNPHSPVSLSSRDRRDQPGARTCVHLFRPGPSFGPDELHIASDAFGAALRAVVGPLAAMPPKRVRDMLASAPPIEFVPRTAAGAPLITPRSETARPSGGRSPNAHAAADERARCSPLPLNARSAAKPPVRARHLTVIDCACA